MGSSGCTYLGDQIIRSEVRLFSCFMAELFQTLYVGVHSFERGFLRLYKLVQRLQAFVGRQYKPMRCRRGYVRLGASMVHRKGDMEGEETGGAGEGSPGGCRGFESRGGIS